MRQVKAVYVPDTGFNPSESLPVLTTHEPNITLLNHLSGTGDITINEGEIVTFRIAYNPVTSATTQWTLIQDGTDVESDGDTIGTGVLQSGGTILSQLPTVAGLTIGSYEFRISCVSISVNPEGGSYAIYTECSGSIMVHV